MIGWAGHGNKAQCQQRGKDGMAGPGEAWRVHIGRLKAKQQRRFKHGAVQRSEELGRKPVKELVKGTVVLAAGY